MSKEKIQVPWLGKIPEEWSIAKAGHYFNHVKNVNTGMIENNLLSLSYGKIIRKDINSGDGLLPESFEGYNVIQKDDIVLRMTDLQNDHTSLRQGIAEEKGIVTSAYISLRATKGLKPKYAYYQFYAFDIRKGWYGMGGGVRQGVKYSDIKQLELVIPPIEDQLKISNYLDAKNDQIDAIIKNTQDSIEALNQYRYRELSNAFTSIDDGKQFASYWRIPRNWDERKIRDIVSTKITDGPHTTPELVEDGVPFVSAEAVKNGRINLDFKRGYISQADHEMFSKKVSPQKGDIFVVKSGATTGNVGIVDTDEIFDIWSPLALIRTNETMVPEYVYYFLQSELFRLQVELYWSFGTQQNIGMGVLEQLKIPVPPIQEQQKVVNSIQTKITAIDVLIQKKKQVIDELQSYRQSLIYEVVTGKKGVTYGD